MGQSGLSIISTIFLSLMGNSAFGQPCITDIGQAFDTLEVNGSADVCALDKGPWTGTVYLYASVGSGIFSGSLLSMFSFRPRGWQNAEENDLQIKLNQVSTHVWKLGFDLDGKGSPYSDDDREPLYVWARDTTAIPEVFGTVGETDARFFYCRFDGRSACRTTYKVPYCRSYSSNFPSRTVLGPEDAVLILYAESDRTPEELLETFGPLNDAVDTLMQDLMAHTCRAR
jgi:hypothetical protein